MASSEKDTLVKLSAAQENPYLARPEDFAFTFVVAFNGQNGDSPAEYRKLVMATHEDPLFSKWSGKSGRDKDGRLG